MPSRLDGSVGSFFFFLMSLWNFFVSIVFRRGLEGIGRM